MLTISFLSGFLGLAVLTAISSPLWLYWLANSRQLAHISPFTTLRDGEAKVVMRGKSFLRAIARKEGWTLVTPENRGTYPRARLWDMVEERNPPTEPFLQKWLGLYWVGLPPFQRLFNYTFDWVAYQTGEGETVPQPVKKTEELVHVFVKDSLYWGKLTEAETEDKVPVDLEFLVTLRVINPYRALFGVHRYLESILDLVQQQGREYVGTRTFDELVQSEGGGGPSFGEGISSLKLRVREEYGVCIADLGILSVDPAGSAREEYRQASTAAYLAEAKKVTVITAAEGEAEAVRLLGEAREEALKAQIRAYSQNPQAAQATLNAEAARAMGVEHLARAVTAGIRAGFTAPPSNEQPPATPPAEGE